MLKWLIDHKVIVLDVVLVLIIAINGAITQDLFPNWIVYLSWAAGILNAIKMVLTGQEVVAQTKRAVAAEKLTVSCNDTNAALNGQIKSLKNLIADQNLKITQSESHDKSA